MSDGTMKRRTVIGGALAALAALLRPRRARADRGKDTAEATEATAPGQGRKPAKLPIWIGHR